MAFDELAGNRAPVLIRVADNEALALRSCAELETGRVAVGMQLDAQRCRDVLAIGWRIDLGPHELPVTGMHGLEPIPVLSAVPGLAAPPPSRGRW